MMNFELEYELRLQTVKSQFLACQQWELVCFDQEAQSAAAPRLAQMQQQYADQLRALQDWVRANFAHFEPNRVSSLMAVPSQSLNADERIMHRIWLGGPLPELAQEAIRQWGCALDQVRDVAAYQLRLWVWDAQQMQNEPAFSADSQRDQAHASDQGISAYPIGTCRIGTYCIGTQVLAVHSLRQLAAACLPDNRDLLDHLHDRRYFVNLSDIFRLLILRECGGIYLDADTMPYRPATLFLAKPEVPDFIVYQMARRSEKIRQCHISWMNLFHDENGMLVAKKGNPALAGMCAQIDQNLLKIRFCESATSPASLRTQSHAAAWYASALHDATYGVWQQSIGHSFLSHHELMQRHGVLYDAKPEPVLAGLHGMRLVVDAISNQKVPLDASEQAAYATVVAALEQRGGDWPEILELEQVAQVFALDEVPRMAYPPQLRSRLEYCHYYSFLSEDPALDQANTLFARYLMQKNALRIAAGGYWHPTAGTQRTPMPLRAINLSLRFANPANAGQATNAVNAANAATMHFLPGHALAESTKNRMAKLLFATSYLEYCSVNNKRQLPLVALQRLQNIDPWLAFTYGMFDRQQQFIGFFCAATMAEFASVATVSHYRDEIKPMDDAYDAFVAANTAEGDLFVSSLAIDEAHKGQGHFHALMAEIRQLAQRKQCRHITLAVWGGADAYQVYLKQGFKVRGTFDWAWDKFYDRLYFMNHEVVHTAQTTRTNESEQPCKPKSTPSTAITCKRATFPRPPKTRSA